MRDYIRIVEQADADDMYGDSSRLHPFARQGGQEFGDKGRADIPARRNNPRFADNSMATGDPDATLVNEFAGDDDQVDQLHQMLLRHVSDVEIKQGIKLSAEGRQKVAAKMGISDHAVDALLNALTQNLHDAEQSDEDMLLSDYYTTMDEAEDPGVADDTSLEGNERPFEEGAVLETSRFSIEPDLLGNVTVRDSQTGKERFVQGSAASQILAQIEHGADPDQLLAPLVEKASRSRVDFKAEIKAPAGTYNFPWQYQADHGLATAFYRTDVDTPQLRIDSVRDQKGDEIDEVDPQLHAALLTQAQAFIGHE